MAATIANAYVQVIPSAQGIAGSLTNLMNGEGTSAGESTGKSFASSFAGMAKKALVGLGIGKIVKDAIGSTSEFETSMAKVSTLFTGDGKQFASLQNDILSLSSAYGLGATTLAEAAYSAESAGVSMENLTDMLSGSAQLALAGFTDVDTALSATAKTMNAYGENLKSISGETLGLEDVQKILIQTQNLGITTVGELGASLANVTPTAAATGVSFDQVGAALAQMTAAGVPTAQATTQLRSAMTELGKAGTKADAAFREAAKDTKYAGKSFQEAMASGANLGDVFGLMQSYADATGLSMVDLWGSVEAGNAAMLIAGDVEKFNSNLQEMGTELDVVGDAYKKMSDTFGGSMNRLKESATNFMTTLFTGGDIAASFDQMLGNLGDVGAKAGDWLMTGVKGLAENLPQMMGSLLDFGGSILESLGQVDWIDLGVTIVNGIIGALGTLGTRLITVVSDGIKAVVNGDVPFADIGTALWNGVTSVITTAGEWLKTLFDAAVSAVTGENGVTFDGIGTAILNGVKASLDISGQFLADLFGLGRDAAANEESMGYSSIGTTILSGVHSALDTAGAFLSNLFKSGKDTVESETFGWNTVGDAIKTGVSLALNGGKFISAIFEGGWNMAKAVNWAGLGGSISAAVIVGLDGVKELMRGIFAGASTMVQAINWAGLGGSISALVITGLDGAKDLIRSTFDGARQMVQAINWAGLGGSISSLVISGLDNVKGLMTDVFDGARKMIRAINWAGLGGSVSSLVISGLEGVKDLTVAVFEGAVSLVQGIEWGGLGSSISGLVIGGLDGVKGLMTDTFDGARKMIRAINWSSLGAGISNAMETGLKGAGKILEDAFTAAHSFITAIDWAQAGRDIQSGLGDVWSGITGFIGGTLSGAGAAIEGVGEGIGAAAEGAGQAIAKLFNGDDAKQAAEDLKQAMTDLETAIKNGKADVEKAAKDIGAGILKSLEDELSVAKLNNVGKRIVTGIDGGIGLKSADLATTVSTLQSDTKAGFEGGETYWSDVGSYIVGQVESGIGLKSAGFTKNSGVLMDNAIKEMKGRDWVNVGAAVVQGIVAGINAWSYYLYNTMYTIARNALAAAKDALGIASPSKVMRDQVGQWIPAGIAEGIEANAGMVTDAMNDLAHDTTAQGISAMAAQGTNIGSMTPASAGGGSEVYLQGMAAEIVNAIRTGIENAKVPVYLDGRDVTDEISRRLGDDITARRFA